MDADSDGRISQQEWAEGFPKLAKDKAFLTQLDLMEMLSGRPTPTPAQTSRGASGSASPAKNQRLNCFCRGESLCFWQEAPRVNQPAPDFSLRTSDEKRQVRLSQFKGHRPVVLVCGSCTCPPWRQQVAVMEDLKRRYGGQVEFLMIYTREAHPSDGWRTEANDRVGLTFAQPKEMAERRKIAEDFRRRQKLAMEVLIDEMDDRVATAYNSKPSRYFVIDSKGLVAYRAEGGPFGLNPAALEQSLILLLLAESQAESSQTRKTP